MGVEIERKFLVKPVSEAEVDWRALVQSTHLYRQGYIPTVSGVTVRIRLTDRQAWITLKSKTKGISRQEFEYAIPPDQAGEMLDLLCSAPIVEKYRYTIPWQGKVWQVDEFLGDNLGLILAEVELASEQDPIVLPAWIGQEVSADSRYYNSNLAKHPFREWSSVS